MLPIVVVDVIYRTFTPFIQQRFMQFRHKINLIKNAQEKKMDCCHCLVSYLPFRLGGCFSLKVGLSPLLAKLHRISDTSSFGAIPIIMYSTLSVSLG